jgi:hypothetical protein
MQASVSQRKMSQIMVLAHVFLACGATENQIVIVWRLPRSASRDAGVELARHAEQVGLVCRAGGRPSSKAQPLLAVMDAMKMEHTIDTG